MREKLDLAKMLKVLNLSEFIWLVIFAKLVWTWYLKK